MSFDGCASGKTGYVECCGDNSHCNAFEYAFGDKPTLTPESGAVHPVQIPFTGHNFSGQ